MLEIKNLSVGNILKGVNLTVPRGARALLSGANGSGKTTLVNAIIGHPDYKTSGQIILDGADISGMATAERMRVGLFVGLQTVPEIAGLSVMTFLKHSYMAHFGDVPIGEITGKLRAAMARLDIPDSWLARSINVGFSGGEKKRLMFLHLMIISPKMAVLDEPDSGADPDTRDLFGQIINEMPGTTFLIISHQQGWFTPTSSFEINELANGKNMI